MENPFPAVLVGGPPNAGKSVLTYNLTQALRRRTIPHYVLRANPDGDGDWTQEALPDTVRQIYIKGKWTDEFIQLVCRDLKRRPLPLIVDLGGLPTEKEECMFRAGTHSLLLLKADEAEVAQHWRHFVATYGLTPLAELDSDLAGVSSIVSHEPVLKGTIAGLIRHTTIQNTLFKELVERVGQLFSSYTADEIEAIHLNMAPTKEVANLRLLLRTLEPGVQEWEPGMLPRLFAMLPSRKELAVYGRGPNWLYGALAVQPGAGPFYQFDARLGWVVPPPLRVGATTQPTLRVDIQTYQAAHVLSAHPMRDYLDYTEAGQLEFPLLPDGRGLILNGKIPLWLVTALVRFYSQMNAAWIACYQPKLNGAVVVTSRTTALRIGDLVPMPVP